MSHQSAYLTPEADTPELTHAWGHIIAAYGDASCLDQDTGEVWQYMGSHNGPTNSGTGAGTWKHTFRHRCLPATGERTYVDVRASSVWRPTSPSTVSDEQDDIPW
jgi:hypothetical protein